MKFPKPDARVLKKMFGKAIVPVISLTLEEISREAQKLAGRLSISGVQPKLSMALEGNQLVSVARDGRYILKPQTRDCPELPQNEFLCLQMARRFGIKTADHLLLELADGTAAYLVKRFDRIRHRGRLEKLACEDMQQILGGSDKYAGSHEQIARATREHCLFAPLESQRLFEQVVFNFAIGNGDAHRKNFSLLTSLEGQVALCPAYDLVSSRLVIPAETDELCLSLNGKRSRLQADDFLAFANAAEVAQAHALKKIRELVALQDEFVAMAEASALSHKMQKLFTGILKGRLERLKGC